MLPEFSERILKVRLFSLIKGFIYVMLRFIGGTSASDLSKIKIAENYMFFNIIRILCWSI